MYVCDSCGYCPDYRKGQDVNFIFMSDLKDENGDLLYPDSNFTYCFDCWENRDNKDLGMKCDKCEKNYSAYNCTKDSRYVNINRFAFKAEHHVCFNCKCDGVDCDYCERDS